MLTGRGAAFYYGKAAVTAFAGISGVRGQDDNSAFAAVGFGSTFGQLRGLLSAEPNVALNGLDISQYVLTTPSRPSRCWRAKGWSQSAVAFRGNRQPSSRRQNGHWCFA